MASGALALGSALGGLPVVAVLTAAVGLALLGVVVEDARSTWRWAPRPAQGERARDGRTPVAGVLQTRPLVVPHPSASRPLRASPAAHGGGVLRPPVPVQRRRGPARDVQEELLKVVLLDLVAAGTAWSTASLADLLSREEDRVGGLLERLRRQEDEARRVAAARTLQELAELRSRLAAAAPAGVGAPATGTGGSDAVEAASRPVGAVVTLDEGEAALAVLVRYLAPAVQARTPVS